MDPVEHFSQQGFVQFLAFEPVNAGGGTATIRLTPKPEHLNHNGTIDAAVLYGLAEVAGAGAVVADMLELAAENYTLVRRATIEYLAPARGIVEATGHVDGAEIEYAKAQLVAEAAGRGRRAGIRERQRGNGGGHGGIHDRHQAEAQGAVAAPCVGTLRHLADVAPAWPGSHKGIPTGVCLGVCWSRLPGLGSPPADGDPSHIRDSGWVRADGDSAIG